MNHYRTIVNKQLIRGVHLPSDSVDYINMDKAMDEYQKYLEDHGLVRHGLLPPVIKTENNSAKDLEEKLNGVQP